MGRVAPADEVGAEVGAREGHCIGDGGEPPMIGGRWGSAKLTEGMGNQAQRRGVACGAALNFLNF